MTVIPGICLGPYQIVALLGRGGMGEVYRAIDTRIDRTVAVKILSGDGSGRPELKQRFIREARAVARLSHPNICPLYDLGEQDGVAYLVMEYLEGETLAARLARGPLPLDDALRYGIALAQAVATAHAEGIVHRDIKPSNIMSTVSGPKLLDFGLAKLREVEVTPLRALGELSTARGSTREGVIVGTVAYMAPEQLEGRMADARTDIYSLGLVIYEMITGKRVFSKSNEAAVIAAIFTEAPPSIRALQPGTPPAVEEVVLKCLAKSAGDRWQAARDLARELAAAATDAGTMAADAVRRASRRRAGLWSVTAAVAILTAIGASSMLWNRGASASTRNLVVLPCRSTTDAVGQAYCDGLADTISAKLMPAALSRGLQMTSTNEVRQRGVTSAAAARRDFGATLVLEGSILRAGDTLRVNYTLVDAATLRQIDAYSLTTQLGDPFGLQDRVSEWATRVLALQSNPPERQTLASHGTDIPGAYEFYLQGRGYLLDYQRPGNTDNAIDLFNRALSHDSRYAPAYAGLGQAFWQKYETTHDPSWIAQAQTACSQAAALGSNLATSHSCLGTIALGTGRHDEAAQHFERALESDPANDDASLGLARAQQAAGEVAAAEATYKRAAALRPQYWATHVWLGTFYRGQARYPEAVSQYELAVALTPDNARAWYVLGGLYGSVGRHEDGVRACRTSVAIAPSVAAYSNWGMTYFRLRRFADAVEKFRQALAVGPEEYRIDGNMARAYYWAGNRAEALKLYKRAIELGERALTVNPRDRDARLSLADYYAKTADGNKALAYLRDVSADTSDPHELFFGATVYAALGDRAAALDRLEQAVARGLPFSEIRDWVELDTLRNEPRYAKLSR